jgi:hypothetical protein
VGRLWDGRPLLRAVESGSERAVVIADFPVFMRDLALCLGSGHLSQDDAETRWWQ